MSKNTRRRFSAFKWLNLLTIIGIATGLFCLLFYLWDKSHYSLPKFLNPPVDPFASTIPQANPAQTLARKLLASKLERAERKQKQAIEREKITYAIETLDKNPLVQREIFSANNSTGERASFYINFSGFIERFKPDDDYTSYPALSDGTQILRTNNGITFITKDETHHPWKATDAFIHDLRNSLPSETPYPSGLFKKTPSTFQSIYFRDEQGILLELSFNLAH